MKSRVEVRGWGLVDINNLAELDDADLGRLKTLIDEETTKIKTQLADAKTIRITQGVYADRDWYVRAERAAKYFGHLSQLVQAEFSRRKALRRQAAQSESLSFERAFFAVAKRRLNLDVYSVLCEEARAMLAAASIETADVVPVPDALPEQR